MTKISELDISEEEAFASDDENDSEIHSIESSISESSQGKNTSFLILEDNGKTIIKYIYHISDIHINNTKRHIEYNEVFNRVYEKLKKLIGDDKKHSLIVLTGDIMHGKTELSPESIKFAYYFLKNLSDIATVILIPGNHDFNLSNRDRLDALSPIVDDIGKLENFYYLKKSGMYQYYNIVFGFTSVLDDTLIKSDKIDKDVWINIKQHTKYKIALYHGGVQTSVTDVGHRMKSDLVIDDFDGYDYVLLGDVHRHQYLNDEKTIAYSGSLIQQDYGEELKGHGFIRWDLSDSSSKFYEIKNDYGFIKLKIKNGILENDQKQIPPKPRIWFILEDTNKLQYTEIKDKLSREYQIVDCLYDTNFNNRLSNKLRINKKEKKKKQQTQESIITDYMTKKKYSENKIEKILTLHEIIKKKVYENNPELNKVESSVINPGLRWTPLKLKFSNTLSYGEDNIIDFRSYSKNKIIGICGANYSGKSNILDIILFCLFDKISRGERRDIMNKNAKKMYCSLLFQTADNQQYLIERIGARNKNGHTVKIDVNFYSFHYNGNKTADRENLNGLDKNDTNTKICEVIGEYNDYIATSISLQLILNNKNSGNFMDMTPLRKKEYLNDILKLNVFEHFHDYAKEVNRELSAELKILEQKVNLKSLVDIKYACKKIKFKIKKLELQKKNLSEDLTELVRYMVEYFKKPNLNTYDELSNYGKLNTYDKIKNTIANIKDTLSNTPIISTDYKIQIHAKKIELKLLEKQIKILRNSDEINKLRNKIEKNIRELKPLQDDLKNIDHKQEELITLKSKIKTLTKPTNIDQNEILVTKEKLISLKEQIYPVSANITNKLTKLIPQLQKLEDSLVRSLDSYSLTHDKRIELNIQLKERSVFYEFIKCTFDEISKTGFDDIREKHQTWIDSYLIWKKKITTLLECRINNLDELYDSYRNMRLEFSNLHIDKFIKLNNEIITLRILSVENKLDKLKNKKNEQLEYKIIEEKIKLLEDKINRYKSYQLDIESNELINESLNENKHELAKLEKEINILEKNRSDLSDEIETIETKLEEEKSSIQKYNTKLKHLVLLEKYYMLFIIYTRANEQHENWINRQTLLDDELKMIDIQIEKKQGQLDIYRKELETYLAYRKDFDQKSSESNLYQLYIKIMNYNGLPYELIKSYLPLIESDVNHVLHSITNFSIEIVFYEEDNNTKAAIKEKQFKSNAGCVDINICYEGIKSHTAQLASGFQRFLIGLAIRITLTQISLTPKPNFLVIDEGWSFMDEEHLNQVDKIINHIKYQYDHVIIISHLKELKNQYDYIIHVNKKSDKDPSYVKQSSNLKIIK